MVSHLVCCLHAAPLALTQVRDSAAQVLPTFLLPFGKQNVGSTDGSTDNFRIFNMTGQERG